VGDSIERVAELGDCYVQRLYGITLLWHGDGCVAWGGVVV